MTYIGIRALPVTFGEHAAKRFEHEQETFYHASALKVERSLCDYLRMHERNKVISYSTKFR